MALFLSPLTGVIDFYWINIAFRMIWPLFVITKQVSSRKEWTKNKSTGRAGESLMHFLYLYYLISNNLIYFQMGLNSWEFLLQYRSIKY